MQKRIRKISLIDLLLLIKEKSENPKKTIELMLKMANEKDN